jgi:hypothetical protein
MKRAAIAFLVLGVVLLAERDATATQQGYIVMQNWRSMDDCTRKAQIAFPDFTAEANAKRDNAVKTCLEMKNMPPRQPLSPPGH